MFGVNPYYTTAPFSFSFWWTWAPKSMRKGQLDCDGPHFKRPKEREEEGEREHAVSWETTHVGFSSCVHRHTHNPEGLVKISRFSAILMPLLREKETGDFSFGITKKHHRSSVYKRLVLYSTSSEVIWYLCLRNRLKFRLHFRNLALHSPYTFKFAPWTFSLQSCFLKRLIFFQGL